MRDLDPLAVGDLPNRLAAGAASTSVASKQKRMDSVIGFPQWRRARASGGPGIPNAGACRPGFPLSRERRDIVGRSRQILAEMLEDGADRVHRRLAKAAD